MYQDRVVLCGSKIPMKKKYYLNEDFKALSAADSDELKIIVCAVHRRYWRCADPGL